MKKLSILLLICTIFVSCSQFQTPSRYTRNFTYCNQGQYTGLDTLINIHGVYDKMLIEDMYNRPFRVHRIDTIHINIMFWDDGTTAYNFWGEPSSYQSYFDEVLSETEKWERKNFYKNDAWGNYRIEGDTIKAQYLHAANSLNDHWYGFEVALKIIDRNTLVDIPIMTKSLDFYIDETMLKADEEAYKQKKPKTIIFFPVERIPPPDCRIKQKKWFWCNENDWKKYVDNLRNCLNFTL